MLEKEMEKYVQMSWRNYVSISILNQASSW